MNAEWRWDFAIEILPNMLWATLNTILAAGIGYAIAAIVGLLFLLGQRTPIKIVNIINREIVEFIRSTPLLIQLFFVYFVLPQFGITFISLGMWNDYNWSYILEPTYLKCIEVHLKECLKLNGKHVEL
jgi:His/Glu/Gln/Arg/opine family amino acid ABC transporter permease subunit